MAASLALAANPASAKDPKMTATAKPPRFHLPGNCATQDSA